MYNETLRQCLHGDHEEYTARAPRNTTSPPHPSPIADPSPVHYDGLKVLDPHQSTKGGRVVVEMLLSGYEKVPSVAWEDPESTCGRNWGPKKVKRTIAAQIRATDSEDASRPSSPAPAAKAAAPAASTTSAPTRGTQKPRGGPAARGGKYYPRGGANKSAPKDANPNQNGVEETEGQRKPDNRPRGRGGRGGAQRGGRRPFDKHSQTGKTDSDKKIQQSWGGADGNTELKNEQDATVDATAEANEWTADTANAADWGSSAPAEGAPAAEGEKAEGRPRREKEPEEEDNTLTLDQYLAQQKDKESIIPKLEGPRQANDGADTWKDVVPMSKDEDNAYFVGKTKTVPKARAKKEEKQFIEIDARFERPDRGGRGRGRGGDRGDRPRGGRGRGAARGSRSAPAPAINAQAQELRDYFLSLPPDERPTAIFSSPFYRCLQTTQPVASGLGLPIYVEHGLAEWFSPVVPGTGLHPRPGSAESLKQYFPEISTEWSSVWYASRKGEDVAQVHDRTDGFLEAFAVALEHKFPGKRSRILLVSHAATVITLVRSLLGNRALPVRVGCCSLSTFDRLPESQQMLAGWKATCIADGSHLKDGASRDWGFEDIEIANGKVRKSSDSNSDCAHAEVRSQVVDDPGVPGSEHLNEGDDPVGSQVSMSSNL
ncbi:hypothetical protein H0H92_012671 [Tricholoma furcatifolium]|nr:hypothetical protein H0H92_012671 [Tricholoma furcatifolium]